MAPPILAQSLCRPAPRPRIRDISSVHGFGQATAYHTFGGWKRSAFGDLNQRGPDSVRFYTKTKTVTSRWPSGVKEGAEFVIPTMK